ncbi:Ras guanine nucleotide exchange factor [Balamuthia mandrillaris]
MEKLLLRTESRLSAGLDPSITEAIMVPRSQWLPRVMRKHPEVLELRERFRPLGQAASFGRVINSSKTEVKETLSHVVKLKLILQCLREEGLHETAQLLEEESGVKYVNSEELPPETLKRLLQVGIDDPNRVFDPLPSEEDDEDDAEVHVYDFMPANAFDEEGQQELAEMYAEEHATNLLLDKDTKEVQAGNLNTLVAWLTSISNPDLDFRKIFLFTYQSFTTPEVLLSKLIQRYHMVSNVIDSKGLTMRKQIHHRIFTVIKYWLENHQPDWNEKLVSSLNTWIDNTLVTEGHLKLAMQLRNALAKLEGSKLEEPQQRVEYTNTPEPKVPKNIFSPTLTLDAVDEEEIARQLTLLEFELYVAIQPSELLCNAWCDPVEAEQRAPTVVACLRRFNEIARWVTTSILDVQKVKQRAKVMARFIKIADHLRKQGNFNTLMAVFSGLNNVAVYRLRFTRRELPRETLKILEELEKLLSHENSYEKYREYFNKAKAPAIPFLGLHLRDLAFVEEANDDDIIHNNAVLINFTKRKCVWALILDTLSYQMVPFNFHHVHQISTLLHHFPAHSNYSEEEMYLKSLTIEPKNLEVLL